MTEYERIRKLLEMGYTVTYVTVFTRAITYTYSKEFEEINRDLFGNAVGGTYTRVDSVEVTHYDDGTIEITR